MRRLLPILILSFFITACGSGEFTLSENNTQKETTAATDTGTSASAPDRNLILSSLSSASPDSYRSDRIIVKFKSGMLKGQSAGVHAMTGGSTIRQLRGITGAELVRVPDGMDVKEAVSLYMQNPLVEYAEPNYIRNIQIFPNDTYFSQQWALHNTGQTMNAVPDADMDMPEAWGISTGSRDFIVAVIDTGIDDMHPDLGPNIWKNPVDTTFNSVDDDLNGYIDDVYGWNFVNDGIPFDDYGHGTHVSGIIGAFGNNGVGIAGVNWFVRIMPLKVCDEEGYCDDADIAEGIAYASDMGAHIINASLGGGPEFSQTLYDVIDYANTKGAIFVTSAGNEHSNNDIYPMYPASYSLPNIISVAASDQDDQLAAFSNYGLASVDVAAPGNHTLSTYLTYIPAGGYQTLEGTSMASPHVAGLAALLMDYYRDFTIYQIKAMIETFVDRLPQFSGYVATGGRVNAYSSISALLSPTGLTASSDNLSSAVLQWNDIATGEDGYKIERKAEDGSSFVQIATVPAGSSAYSDTTVTAGATYTYRVRAYNSIGESPAYSNEATVTVPLKKSGGGGGCSVAASPTDPPYASADLILLALPLIIYSLRRWRRNYI